MTSFPDPIIEVCNAANLIFRVSHVIGRKRLN